VLDWQTVDRQQGERQTVSRTHMKRSQAETDMQVAGRQEQVTGSRMDRQQAWGAAAGGRHVAGRWKLNK
jgi:hypothetical protein